MQTTSFGETESFNSLQAREAFVAYRALVREGRGTEDDELLMRAYREIANGRRVLDLRETLRTTGLDEQFRPRLAIARADLPEVVFTRVSRFSRWCFAHNRDPRVRSLGNSKVIPVPRGVYPALDAGGVGPGRAPGKPGNSWDSCVAVVPTIPAQFRPRSDLARYHILFEAVWQPLAPLDPILLKRIGAHLYAVLAQWDLTELERSVIAARLS